MCEQISHAIIGGPPAQFNIVVAAERSALVLWKREKVRVKWSQLLDIQILLID